VQGRLLNKGPEIIGAEDEKDSSLIPENQEEAFDLLLSTTGKSTLSTEPTE